MIGLFGGSFDPIHLGHLSIATHFLQYFPATRVLFSPAAQNPLKKNATLAPAELRLRMVEAGLKEFGEKRFEILDWEIRREGPSFTIDTLERLSNNENEIALVMGDEVFSRFAQWHRANEILKISHIVVASRMNTDASEIENILSQVGAKIVEAATTRLGQIHHSLGHWIEWMPIKALPYSATQIRADISAGKMPQGIQRSVWQVIKENRLYAVDR